MDLNLHQLQIFLTVARERSFSRAADKLRISQPSVSIQIKKLEDALQVELLERLGRRIYLTRAGGAVLEHVKNLRDIVAKLEHDIKGLKDVGRG